MSPSQELSNIYGSNTNLVEVQTSLVIESYNQLRDAIYDLEQDLNNLDVSNATEFIDELENILTSDLTESNLKETWQWGHQPAPEVIQVNLPFTKAQLLRLTRNAFASLLCDHRLSLQARNRIGEIYGDVAEVINSLFSNIPQPEPIEVANPMQEAEQLHQMFASSTRYGVISLADARNTIRGLIYADATNDELAGGRCGQGLHELINVLLEHIADNVVSCHEDLNYFLEATNNGYVTVGIPCNHHELLMMVTDIFSKLIDAMQPTKREMSEIRSLETSFKQTISNFHQCLVANEIRAYASIR